MIAYTKLQHLLLVLSMPLLTKLSTNGVFALSSMKVTSKAYQISSCCLH